MKITKEIIARGQSSNGGWSTTQLMILGESLTKGWMSRLINKEVTQEQIDDFIKLKNCHLSGVNTSRLKMGKYRKINLPNFVPITKPISLKEQYIHPNWQRMRLITLNRFGYTCIDCGAVDKPLHVHHLKYLRGKYIWEVPHFYLVVLCEDCHTKEHGRDLTNHSFK